jgi:hypothetical protein
MMRPLDAAFETEGDEEAYGDGEEVEQEVADTVHGRVRGMNVEHRWTSKISLVISVAEGFSKTTSAWCWEIAVFCVTFRSS